MKDVVVARGSGVVYIPGLPPQCECSHFEFNHKDEQCYATIVRGPDIGKQCSCRKFELSKQESADE
jgi:hypothetical protein